MSYAIRRAFAPITVAFALVLVVSGCSGLSSEEAGAIGTSGQGAAIGLEVVGSFITVENRAGRPLIDIEVAIKPGRRMTFYTLAIPRMEASDKRDFTLANFRQSDGVRNNLGAAEVLITAKDLGGKTYDIKLPYKP